MVSGVTSSGFFALVPSRASTLSAGRKTGDAGKDGAGAEGTGAAGATDGATAASSLSSDQQKQVQDLSKVDANVRKHEAAHQAAGGPYAGAASFTYTRGPDGKNYATAGEVQVDTSPERTPEATIRKMATVKAAALAPADPSAQDLRVAQQADAAMLQAQRQQRKESTGGSEAQDGAGKPQTGRDGTGRSGDTGAGAGGDTGGALAGAGVADQTRYGATSDSALAARGAAAYGAAFGLGRTTASRGLTV